MFTAHLFEDSFLDEEKYLHEQLLNTLDENELLIIMSNLQAHFVEGLERQKKLIQKQKDEHKKKMDVLSKTHSYLDKSEKVIKKKRTIILGIEMDSSEDLDSSTDMDNSTNGDDTFSQFSLGLVSKTSSINSVELMANFKDKEDDTSVTNDNNNGEKDKPLHPRHSDNVLPNFSGLLGNNYNELKDDTTAISQTDTPKHANTNKLSNIITNKNNTFISPQFMIRKAFPFNEDMDDDESYTDNTSHWSNTSPKRRNKMYRYEKFCDIKFVRDIFLRWISCDNEVLNHVTSEALAILFSHEYLTPDEFLDLAELLLGVHEGFGAFSNVTVTHRESRAGILYTMGTLDEPSAGDNSNKIDSENEEEFLELKHTDITKGDELPAETKLQHGRSSQLSITQSSGSASLDMDSTSSHIDGENDNGIEQLPFDIYWDNRLYSAMNILTLCVQNDHVSDQCIIALDEWIGLIVMDIFSRSHKAGFGVLESFIHLIKATLFRFASKPDIMGESKLAKYMCSEPESLLDIITGRISTLVTRAISLELCPLLMITSDLSEQFAHKCLITVLEDGRFNPFEPGDIQMSRTFQRDADDGKLRTIDDRNPLKRLQTVAPYVSNLLFHNQSKVFVDEESVMRLTFMTVIKAINTLSRKIMHYDDKKDNKDDNNNILNLTKKEKKKRKKRQDSCLMERAILEGEFDSTTARKIRNFFSRDSDYTRDRILELIGEEDDVLIDVLLELLLIETSLKRSKSRLAQRIRYLFDPLLLFNDFIEVTQADHSLLLDFLISNETSFLDYLLRFCKRMSANWHPSRAKKNQVKNVMSILIRLRMQIRNLHNKKLFPYSPKSLLKAMEKMEFCYENSAGAYSGESIAAWNDPNYIEKRRHELKERKKKEEELKKKQARLSRKKTKRIKILNLFKQDVEQQKIETKRTLERRKRTEINLLKREKRKSIKKKRQINDDKKSDANDYNINYNKVNWNGIKNGKKSETKKKKNSKKNKQDIKNKHRTRASDILQRTHKNTGATTHFLTNNVKGIQHSQKLKLTQDTINIVNQFAHRKGDESKQHTVVNAEKTVRIGF